MTGPRAAIRIRIYRDDLDDWGWVSAAALRRIRALLWDVPVQAQVTVDIGRLRHADESLVRTLADVRCAPAVLIEGESMEIATAMTMLLHGRLADVR